MTRGQARVGAAIWVSLALIPPATAQPAGENAGAMESVVVTATLRSETAQQVAGPVTAFGADDMRRLGARTISDLAGFVPGMSYLQETAGSNLLVLRGITTGTSQLGGAVALYLDGVPIGASTPFGLGASAFNVSSFDLDRVEILSGPQGTLYGANALGGAIKYVTAAPVIGDFSAAGESQVSGTAHGGVNHDLHAALNVPVGSAAIRLDGISDYEAGFITDLDHGKTGLGDSHTGGGRLSILMHPLPELTLRLGAFYQSVNSNGLRTAFRDPVTHFPTEGFYGQSYPFTQAQYDQLTLVSAMADWDLHWATLTSVTGYQAGYGRKLLDESVAYDAILAPVYGAAVANLPLGVQFNVDTRKFTQEVRLASANTQSLQWLLGVFYDSEDTGKRFHFINGADPAGLFQGLKLIDADIPSHYREIALFADGTYQFDEKFDVTLGLRYSQNHQTYRQTTQGLLNSRTMPQAITTLAAPPSDESVFTFLVNPRYRISDTAFVYGRVTNGYRPGGPNFVTAASLNTPSFGADRLWNYELGIKSALLDGRAQLDLSVYDIEWTDIQLNENHGGINQIENAGDARVQGVEASANYRLPGDFLVGATASFTDARLTTPVASLELTARGTRLPLSPRFSFALAASHTIVLGDGYALQVRVTDRYLGDRNDGYAGSPVDPLYVLPAYNTVDTALEFSLPGGITLEGFVRNLFDVRGEVSATTFSNHYVPAAPVPVNLSQPRTIGLTARAALNP
jgi:outer membrane receptor protein involved in Fe transport